MTCWQPVSRATSCWWRSCASEPGCEDLADGLCAGAAAQGMRLRAAGQPAGGPAHAAADGTRGTQGGRRNGGEQPPSAVPRPTSSRAASGGRAAVVRTGVRHQGRGWLRVAGGGAGGERPALLAPCVTRLHSVFMWPRVQRNQKRQRTAEQSGRARSSHDRQGLPGADLTLGTPPSPVVPVRRAAGCQ